MSYPLNGITNAMSVIIKRINAPFITTVWVWCVANSITRWISHICIVMFVINFEFEADFSFFVETFSHAFEDFKILLNWPVPEWRRFTLTSKFMILLRCHTTSKSLSSFNQDNCVIVQLLEVITGVP